MTAWWWHAVCKSGTLSLSQEGSSLEVREQGSYVAMLISSFIMAAWLDLRVIWVCVHDLTWHQNNLKVD